MKSSALLFQAVILFIFLGKSLSISAQQQTQNESFVPEVGQAGKDVVWVPTPDSLVKKMLDMAKVTSEDFLIDLGSGDGRTVIAAAKRGATAVGIEYNPEMVALSLKNAKEAGVSAKASFIEADLFGYDFSKASVITMFLLPDINLKLRPKILDLKPGTRIVSNTFTMAEWEPDFEASTEDNWNSWNSAHMWIVPAKVDGKWSMENGELDIRQEFQMIYGTLKTDKNTINITEGRLNGDIISFSLGTAKYSGRVDGKSKMSGKVTTGTDTKEWKATYKGPSE
jgi:precorrin-6B methylase 2